MSRLADYFVVVGYDHENKREYYWKFVFSIFLVVSAKAAAVAADASSTCFSCCAMHCSAAVNLTGRLPSNSLAIEHILNRRLWKILTEQMPPVSKFNGTVCKVLEAWYWMHFPCLLLQILTSRSLFFRWQTFTDSVAHEFSYIFSMLEWFARNNLLHVSWSRALHAYTCTDCIVGVIIMRVIRQGILRPIFWSNV
jgi:hypothetical protein